MLGLLLGHRRLAASRVPCWVAEWVLPRLTGPPTFCFPQSVPLQGHREFSRCNHFSLCVLDHKASSESILLNWCWLVSSTNLHDA